MFFARSVLASAALLSFSATTQGSVLHRNTDEHVEVKRVATDEAQGAWSWKSLFAKRQDLILDCPNDQFAALLDSAPNDDVQGFCNDWLNLAPATVIAEVTPTSYLTIGSSVTTTQTITSRTVVTTTVFETATVTTSASVRRRMVAAAAAIESIASSIVDSVIASGTPTSTIAASSKGANRLAAERGLATACSCKQVQPTSTVTQIFTVPNAVVQTVGVRVLRIVQQTETKTYTSTTTVREPATVTASGDVTSAASSTDEVSSRGDAASSASSSAAVESSADAASAASQSSSASSSSAETPSSLPAITTVPIFSTSVETGNSTATAVEGAAVVTAIPFSCDEDDINKDIDQVVGGLRLGYSVYCNTGLVSQDRVGRPLPATDPTSCAAQCSLLNSQGAQDACQSAVFTPSNSTDASAGGTCELFSAQENSGLQTTPAPGSVAIVHTGTFANGDECAALNATTSSIVPTITDGPIVIETPGLVTQSSGGGVSRTYVSANTTDAQGFVHYSWYEIYASSANWWAVYETSWACSATLTRTIEQPATTVIEGSTITSVIVTTIIGNGYTTIISGDSTTTIRGGGGAGGATFVPASTTGAGGDAGLTTFFSTAVQASTGSDGIVTPTPAPSPGGVGNVTVIEEFSTFYSTGSQGIITPSASVSPNASVSVSITEVVIVSSTATTLTLSGANSTFTSVGSGGVITPSENPIVETIVSSGAVTFTLSGSNATVTSTGGSGVISPPASSSVSASSTVSSSTEEEEWDSEISYGPKTSAIVIVSSKVLTITSTGASGVETPTVITAVSSETRIVEISNTTISGNGSFAVSTSTATLNSTGGEGIVPPTIITEIITTATGAGNFTITLGTATANSTGGTGVIPPGNTLVVTETLNTTLPVPTPTGGFSTGTGNFTITLGTATANSTGGTGVIPPGSTLVVTETLNTTLSVPTPTGGVSTGGAGNFSTGFETGFTTSTGASGVIPPASANSTTTGPAFTNSEGDRTGSIRTTTSTANSTGSSGFATPSANLTITVPLSTGFTTTLSIPIINSTIVVESPPTPTPSAPANVTSSVFSRTVSEPDRAGSISRSSSVASNTTSTLTLPVSTGSTVETPENPIVETTPPPQASESGSTLVVTTTTDITLSLSSGNITLIPPTTRPFNSTAPLPTPTGNISTTSLVSINWSTVPSFSTGNLSTILPPSSTSNITIVIPSPTTNITIIVETPFVPLNSTTAPPPSVTIPPASLNSTSTGPRFTNSEGDRNGTFTRTRASSLILTTGSSGSGNITATPPPFPTGNSTLPSGPTAQTTEACPSPTEFATLTREVIITTYTVETIPIIASSCISTDAAPTGLNGTFATGSDAAVLSSAVESLASAIESLTATDVTPTPSEAAPVVSAILSAISSVASELTASTTSDAGVQATATPISRFRRSGTLATQEQIDAACNDSGNLILSPTLNIQPNNSTEGWFISRFDPTIPVSSVTQDNGTIARFRSAFPGRTAALSQPLTLCPGTQYTLSGLTRQRATRSGCTVQFRIGSNSVFTASPQTSWTTRTERFTAGAGAEGASQDITLVMSCAGFSGAAVGADPEGYMVGEVGAVSVSAEQFRQ